jgi:hypothetical protein
MGEAALLVVMAVPLGVVIARSEATTQSRAGALALDCFVAAVRLLAMTVDARTREECNN